MFTFVGGHPVCAFDSTIHQVKMQPMGLHPSAGIPIAAPVM
jgi:hypothetical protein